MFATAKGVVRVWKKAGRCIADNFRQNSYAGYLAIVRILVGYHFLEVGWPKVARGFYTGESLPARLANATLDPLGWHREFIFEVVVPNPVLFSYLVAFGEVAIGLSLLTGCLVRVASLFGAFHNFNILFAIAIPAADSVQIRLNRLYIFLHLLFVIAAAGRSLGVDGWLKKKFPRCWLL
ncbi:MAG: DoxX family protein [Acidobacteria bacterium]|nr:DoxX family protein [Acidobacteriota bacterium]